MAGATSPLLGICPEPGCTTITLGSGPCIAHDVRPRPVFVRGKPFPAQPPAPVQSLEVPALAGATAP